MSKKPITPQELEQFSKQFQAKRTVRSEMKEWLERHGQQPPECIVVRATNLGMTPADYYAYYASLGSFDPRVDAEVREIEEWSIGTRSG